MTTCLGKSCSFRLACGSSVNVYQNYSVSLFLFGIEGGMWDVIVLIPDNYLFTIDSVSKVTQLRM